jgi:uncharacterized protein YukE/DNA-binding protein YbaB
MTDSDLSAEQARVTELRGQADEVLAGLKEKLDAVRQVQQQALTATGRATSRDGSVQASVDATGVVLSLVFTPTALTGNSPEKLAQITIATIQAAAASARAEVSETLASVRESSSGIFSAAAQAFPELSLRRLSVPPVPRTVTDPGEAIDPWHATSPDRPQREVDPDSLRGAAGELRSLAGELDSNNGDAKAQIEQMLSVNKAQSLDTFNALWQKVANGHLQQLGDGLNMLGNGLDISATVIEGMKLAAIVQLGILAAEIIADQAAAVETLGASEALAAAQTAFTEQVVKRALQQAVQAVEQHLTQVVEGPLFAALEGAAGELAGQLLGDALGTHSGVNLGAVADSGGSGFAQGVGQSGQQVAGAAPSVANDPAGAAGSVATARGVPTD